MVTRRLDICRKLNEHNGANKHYYQDHFAELTGRPQRENWLWRYADPDEHVRTYLEMIDRAPLEIIQPQWGPSPEEREAAIKTIDKKLDEILGS